MHLWQKIVLITTAVFIIAISVTWWMQYDEMVLIISNHRTIPENESLGVHILILSIDNKEIYNETFFLNSTAHISVSNVTNLAGNYYITVTIGNETERQKIKFGKYFEVIEIVIEENEIIIHNEHS